MDLKLVVKMIKKLRLLHSEHPILALKDLVVDFLQTTQRMPQTKSGSAPTEVKTPHGFPKHLQSYKLSV